MTTNPDQDPLRSAPESSAEPPATPWPDAPPEKVVFLFDVATDFEASILEDWIRETKPDERAEPRIVRVPSSRRTGRANMDPALEAICAAEPDAVLSPLRVAWLPEKRGGRRRARASDLILGDPRDPRLLRAKWIYRHYPDRCRRIAAEPATVAALRERWQERGIGEVTSLPSFIQRQAFLALERRERHVRGSRYKIPRLVKSEILERPSFRAALAQIAADTGQSLNDVLDEAERCLREMAAAHSTFMMDLLGSLFTFIFSRGYESQPDFDVGELEHLLELTEKTPVAFVFSHRSHLDGMAMYSIFHDSGLPPSHIIGGENMAVFPLGQLGRRSGAVFIRRSFRDAPVYKATIRQYFAYLLEKRFTLSWALEGTRSRSGKLMPPRLGVLSYVVDAWRNGRVDDVLFVPVSISYDQIVELADYAKEQKGGNKRPESASWFLGFITGIQAPHGRMYVRFGEPLSLAKRYEEEPHAPEADPDDHTIDLQKLAFDLSVRINRATRVTGSALVSLALLGGGRRALTFEEIASSVHDLAAFVADRGIPGASELEHADGARAALDGLVRGGVVSCFDDGPEPVFVIREGRHLAAGYYRNSILHFFLAPALAELAMMAMAKSALPDRRSDDVQLDHDTPSAAASDPREHLLREVAGLRDLLKFEFFFPERREFENEVIAEIARTEPNWEESLRQSGGVRRWYDRRRPLVCHATLRPFVEGYAIVAEQLLRHPPTANFEEGSFLAGCLGLGAQRSLQGRIATPDASTREIFKNALLLAEHRGLLRPENQATRELWFTELRLLGRRIGAIDRIAASLYDDPFE